MDFSRHANAIVIRTPFAHWRNAVGNEQTLADLLFIGTTSAWIAVFVLIRVVAILQGHPAGVWDVGWYLDIAANGYHFDGDITSAQNVAFLPGLPLLESPLLRLGLPGNLAAAIICIGAALIGIVLLRRALQAHAAPLWSAAACSLVMACPFSMYFLNGYPESLFFACLCAFLWALWTRKSDALAALFAGLSCAVRPYGILLAVVWAFCVVADAMRERKRPRDVLLRLAIFGPLCVSGLLLTSLYFYARYGDLFLYRNIMVAWGFNAVAAPHDLVDRFATLWRALVNSNNSTDPILIGRAMFWGGLVLMPLAARRIPAALTFYALLLFAFVLATTESGANLGRHLSTNLALPLGILSLIWSPRSAGESLPTRMQILAISLIWIAAITAQVFLIGSFSHKLWVS
jgi:hypothetical protein